MSEIDKASAQLIDHALFEISRKYNRDGSSPRAYHNVAHTKSVIEDVTMLAGLANLDTHSLHLLKIAAAFHDVIHNGDNDPDNEQNSANYAMERMKSYDCFSSEDIDTVVGAIMSTKCTKKYPKIIQVPRPGEKLDQLVCDADLAALGKPFDKFISTANCYFQELYLNDGATPEQYKRYIEVETAILGNHQFWTKEAEEVFPFAKKNMEELKSM